MTSARTEAPISSLTSRDRHGRGLRIDFLRSGDRYAHRIVGIDGDGRTVGLMESIEDGLETAWPSSPALQELNVEGVAMLIGMAGDGHWSLSVEPLPGGGAPGLVFDVACRVKSLPANLTSTYRVAELVKIAVSSSSLRLATHTGEYHVQSACVDNAAVADSCQLLLGKNILKLACDSKLPDSPPATLRWRYVVRLVV